MFKDTGHPRPELAWARVKQGNLISPSKGHTLDKTISLMHPRQSYASLRQRIAKADAMLSEVCSGQDKATSTNHVRNGHLPLHHDVRCAVRSVKRLTFDYIEGDICRITRSDDPVLVCRFIGVMFVAHGVFEVHKCNSSRFSKLPTWFALARHVDTTLRRIRSGDVGAKSPCVDH